MPLTVFEEWVAARGRPVGEGGQTLVEYAIILALVGVVCMIAVQAMTGGIVGVFGRILGKLGGIG